MSFPSPTSTAALLNAPVLSNHQGAAPPNPPPILINRPNAGPQPLPPPLPDDCASCIQGLQDRIDQMPDASQASTTGIVGLMSALHAAQPRIEIAALRHASHPDWLRLRLSLTRFIGQFAHAVIAGQIPVASLNAQQLEAIFLGLASCVSRPDLHVLCRPADLPLQGLTELLLARAQPLLDADQPATAGRWLNMMEWVMRGLKAGLLTASAPVKEWAQCCFVEMHAWSSELQAWSLDAHNSGKCAACLATLVDPRYALLELDDAQGLQLQRLATILHKLCKDGVDSARQTLPSNLVPLAGVAILLKRLLDSRRLDSRDPALPLLVGPLFAALAGLDATSICGPDIRAQARCANLLRVLLNMKRGSEQAIDRQLATLASNWLDAVATPAFTAADKPLVELSNLVSFVNACARKEAVAPGTFTPGALPGAASILVKALEAHFDADAVHRPPGLETVRGLLDGLMRLVQNALLPGTQVQPLLQALCNSLTAPARRPDGAGLCRDTTSALLLRMLDEGFAQFEQVKTCLQALLGAPAPGEEWTESALRQVCGVRPEIPLPVQDDAASQADADGFLPARKTVRLGKASPPSPTDFDDEEAAEPECDLEPTLTALQLEEIAQQREQQKRDKKREKKKAQRARRKAANSLGTIKPAPLPAEAAVVPAMPQQVAVTKQLRNLMLKNSSSSLRSDPTSWKANG